MTTPYPPPLDQLLALGRPECGHRKEWLDYLAMGFTAEHVPELMRMVRDETLDVEEGPEAFAYVHAWRTLGLLRAEAAIDLLLECMELDNDWAHEELPMVVGMIGPAAIDPLRSALGRWSLALEPWAAGIAGCALVEVAQRFPETRDAVVEILARQLRWWGRHDPILNTMLIHDLVDLKAVEAAPVMEEAFAADMVGTDLNDDWEDVQVALGLLPERVTPRAPYEPPVRLGPRPMIRIVPPRPSVPKPRKKAKKGAHRRKGKGR
jgi:hypothetical protein